MLPRCTRTVERASKQLERLAKASERRVLRMAREMLSDVFASSTVELSKRGGDKNQAGRTDGSCGRVAGSGAGVVGMRDVGGLVALATEGDWRNVGGISVYEQMLGGRVAGDLAQFIGSQEGQNAGEADIATHGDRRFRQGAGRAEAVQQEREIAAGVTFLLQDQGDVGVGVAGVDAGGYGVLVSVATYYCKFVPVAEQWRRFVV
jgi:hypothetical protein